MRSAIFSHTRKTKFGSSVTSRNWTHKSVAMTSSTGSPPSRPHPPARRHRARHKSVRWRLSDKKHRLVKNHRERSEVAPLFQAANGLGYPAHQPRVSVWLLQLQI